MQVIPGLKKRSPFAFASEDNPSTDVTVLDDQEQEEVITSLNLENERSDRQIWLCLRIVMGCFAFLHALYLIRRVNPLSPFLSNAEPTRIPFDIPFALLHAATLLALAVPAQFGDHPLGIRILAPNYMRVYVATAIAPTFCSLTGQGLPNTAWWSFAVVAVALHQFFRSLILQGRENISRLQALKYNARGA
ncbi:hypothetical protein F5148DRAFT_1288051 [Russula earlei]|uniref:Uncharacterized protein n=1 Tax=Russula earlei TaxID=71964 RepID=A0ACC0U0C3_9AGAM|nr:hypothetical protein F5148DRAFT_1288051 [Russula earlei]